MVLETIAAFFAYAIGTIEAISLTIALLAGLLIWFGTQYLLIRAYWWITQAIATAGHALSATWLGREMHEFLFED